jgi:hypothetical protein
LIGLVAVAWIGSFKRFLDLRVSRFGQFDIETTWKNRQRSKLALLR